MAKIKARGDQESRRWRDTNGAELVFTVKGRLLSKAYRGGNFTLVGSRVTLADATRRAEARGMAVV